MSFSFKLNFYALMCFSKLIPVFLSSQLTFRYFLTDIKSLEIMYALCYYRFSLVYYLPLFGNVPSVWSKWNFDLCNLSSCCTRKSRPLSSCNCKRCFSTATVSSWWSCVIYYCDSNHNCTAFEECLVNLTSLVFFVKNSPASF